jgi:hypothetical protein
MPAGLTLLVSLALALSVGGVDFAGLAQHYQCFAIEVHVRIGLHLLLCLDDGILPAPISCHEIESLLNYLPHPVLIHVHHRRFFLLSQYQLTEITILDLE